MGTKGFVSTLVSLIPAITVTFGCGSERSGAATEHLSRNLPPALFQIVDDIHLEENDDVITVTPRLSFDAAGNFLVADSREDQVRVYRPNGTLVTYFGREGGGPGEFGRPRQVHRLSSGSLVVADLSKGIMLFDSSGAVYYGGISLPVLPLYTTLLLSDSLILVAGRQRAPVSQTRRHLLQIWNLVTGEAGQQFFPTPGDTTVVAAAINFGWVDLATRADTIAAVFALTDTLYFFGSRGEPLEEMPLPFERFLRIESLLITNDPIKRQEWLERLHFIEGVFWLPDGVLLIQYERPRGMESEWNLLGVTREGIRLFDLHDTPRLLANRGSHLYFLHPDSETPDRWLIVRLHQS